MLQWGTNGSAPASPTMIAEGYPTGLPVGGALSTTPTAAPAALGAGVESPGLRSASTAASVRWQMGDPLADYGGPEIAKTGLAGHARVGSADNGSIYTERSYVSQSSRVTTRQSVRGSCASTSPPPSSGHGTSRGQRRFMSRHVPDSAEDLVHSQVLTPEMVSRFNGLMRHLKPNTEWDEQQKQVMVSNVEALVPEELEDMLQCEFSRRCSFGDRMNTELMSSFKWIKTLQDCGAIINFDADKRGASSTSDSFGAIPRASADMIFVKVLHDCDYGGKRLTYDLFCKALFLVARAVHPDLNGETSFSELLARMASVAPEDPNCIEPAADLMLDASVINMLDHFKPALHDVFNTFCNRFLESPAHASPGTGSIRLSERTFWKHTQDTIMGTSVMGSTFGRSNMYRDEREEMSVSDGMVSSPTAGLPPRLSSDEDAMPPYSGSLDGDGVVAPVSSTHSTEGGSPSEVAEQPAWEAAPHEAESSAARRHFNKSEMQLHMQNAEADAGGGYAETSRRPVSPSSLLQVDVAEPIYEDRIPSMSIDRLHSPSGGLMGGNTMLTSCNTMYSGCTGASQDPYLYASGQPVIKNRRRHMSAHQMLTMCKDLKIMPDLLSRLEIVHVFKRAQCSGSHNSHGSSLYGYLTLEAFIDAAGQLALEAYSKSPYNEEYPEPHEKITAFFLAVLPSSSREVHERFFYGCSGRGR